MHDLFYIMDIWWLYDNFPTLAAYLGHKEIEEGFYVINL